MLVEFKDELELHANVAEKDLYPVFEEFDEMSQSV